MFKRQLYNVLHGSSSSSSSSSDEDDDSQLQDDAASSQSDAEAQHKSITDSGNKTSTSARNSSESSSEEQENEVEEDDEEEDDEREGANVLEETKKKKHENEFVVQVKGVLKCKVCPKTVCLSESAMETHLRSKGHARSVKKFSEGKLKITLNSDGEEEEAESDCETHAERHARVLAMAKKAQEAKDETKKRKRNLGRQRQRKRAKKKTELKKEKPPAAANGKIDENSPEAEVTKKESSKDPKKENPAGARHSETVVKQGTKDSAAWKEKSAGAEMLQASKSVNKGLKKESLAALKEPKKQKAKNTKSLKKYK